MKKLLCVTVFLITIAIGQCLGQLWLMNSVNMSVMITSESFSNVTYEEGDIINVYTAVGMQLCGSGVYTPYYCPQYPGDTLWAFAFPIYGFVDPSFTYLPQDGQPLRWYLDKPSLNTYPQVPLDISYFSEDSATYSEYITEGLHFKDRGLVVPDTLIWSIQQINMRQGWNLVSTYINLQPFDSIPEVIDTMPLIYMKDEVGQVYNPSFEINNIGMMSNSEAYLIKISEPYTWNLRGSTLRPQQIYLQTGWQTLPVISYKPAWIMSLFSQQPLLIAKNSDGLIYWPYYMYNAIGDVIPGQGYMVKMYAPGVVDFRPYN